MVVGMIVGAIIALFCFLLGYLSGVRFTQNANQDVAVTDEEGIILRVPVDEANVVETEQRKSTSDLFRSKNGLLSYKKFVRE